MKQDMLWEAWVTLAFGQISPTLTTSERGRINKGLKELREIGATPEQIKQKWSAYKAKWPKLGNPSLNALVANWNTLGAQARSPQASYVPPIGKPTEAGYKHAIDCLPKDIQRRLRLKHEGHT